MLCPWSLQCRSAVAGRGRRPRAGRRRRLHRPRPRPRRRPSDRPRRRRPRPCPARTSTATSARAPRAHHSALAPRCARPPLRRTSPVQCPRTVKFNRPLRIEELKATVDISIPRSDTDFETKDIPELWCVMFEL